MTSFVSLAAILWLPVCRVKALRTVIKTLNIINTLQITVLEVDLPRDTTVSQHELALKMSNTAIMLWTQNLGSSKNF